MIQINPVSYLFAALLILILPLDWLAAAIAGSIVHEFCHILILYSLGGEIRKIKIQPDGCIIETGRIGDWSQFLSILAGPLGSFSLLFLCHIAPKVAICGFFQGIYNLIPVLPLDGGRLVRLLLYRFCPMYAERVLTIISVGICFFLSFFALLLTVKVLKEPWPLWAVLIFIIKSIRRKIPCKPSEIGVQ